MVDIKNNDELRQTIEMLFFAYRDFTGIADKILVDYVMGRAHHRAIYFIAKHPKMTVGELLQILKQSLNRVLSKLIQDDFVEQYLDKYERRKRLLALTKKGITLENKLTQVQSKFIQGVFDEVSNNKDVEGFKKTLLSMMKKSDRNILEK